MRIERDSRRQSLRCGRRTCGARDRGQRRHRRAGPADCIGQPGLMHPSKSAPGRRPDPADNDDVRTAPPTMRAARATARPLGRSAVDLIIGRTIAPRRLLQASRTKENPGSGVWPRFSRYFLRSRAVNAPP